MVVGEELESKSSSKKTFYSSVEYQGYTYAVGGCCFLNPDSFSFQYKKHRKSTAPKELDSKVSTRLINLLTGLRYLCTYLIGLLTYWCLRCHVHTDGFCLVRGCRHVP